MGSKIWWRDTVERVTATTAQVLGALITTSLAAVVSGKITWQDLPYELAATVTVLTALASLCKCVAAQAKGDPNSASMTDIRLETPVQATQRVQGI